MKICRSKNAIGSVLLLLYLTSFFSINLYAQDANRSSFELHRTEQPEDVPYFGVDFVNVAADERNLSRLIFKLSFVNDELQFIRAKRKKFRADYEASVVISDTSETEIDRIKKTGFIIAQNFDETNSLDIKNSTELRIALEPGVYNFRIELKDKETQRSGIREGSVTLRDFTKNEFMISDVFAVDSIEVAPDEPASGGENIKPQTELYAYFEVYNVPESDSIYIVYHLLAAGDKVVQQGEQRVKSDGRVTRHYIRLEKLALVSTEHRIKLVIKSKDKSLEVEQELDLSDSDAGPIYANLDEAIEQLVYIAKDDELKKMKSLEGEQKGKAFEEFWKSRDPDPETSMNEYREEYYYRIKFANKRFVAESNKQGWKTEMGMVYIKLGPPDYVATSYNQYRTRYQDMSFRPKAAIVWTYYALRREVIFRYQISEYRIANYPEIFDILNGEMLF
ncbi:GWxTD domain-containing protein [candidate division KSB1 bacterium]|nr:GWxTD domain-containing protein [candidate division KSB1 bacterium]